jgi:hypothetical protein
MIRTPIMVRLELRNVPNDVKRNVLLRFMTVQTAMTMKLSVMKEMT